MSTICLVNPPFTVWDDGAPLPKTLENTTPSFGLCCLAAVLREAGHTPVIVEAGALQLSMKDALAYILAAKPDAVGFRASTASFPNAAALAQAIKDADPRVITLIGGPHVTAIPVETIDGYPQFDFGVVGEGEETIIEALDTVKKNGVTGLRSVSGVVYRREGKALLTQKRPYITDLDTLPMPAWDLLEGFPNRYQPPLLSYKALPVASMVTSRGCPFQCTFCDRSVFGNRYRAYSAGYICRMIEHLVGRYGVKHLLFYDDLFAASRTRLNAICETIIEKKLDVTWSCDAKVDSVTADSLAMMKRAGCWEIAFGIESGSQRILDLVCKGITIPQIERGVRLTHEAGIKVKGLFMMGHPGETRETIKETVDLACRLPFDHINISKLTPYPGSQIYREAHKYGTFNPDWRRMTAMNFVFVPNGFTEEELDREYRAALARFYRRPRKTIELLGALLQDRAGLKRLFAAQNEFLKYHAVRPFRRIYGIFSRRKATGRKA
ncbi:MAG: cobalamin B12-binding domain-containing protein [Deltaproteobacteria bacterium]|nr:cobalamin B12-binding domain-containing protein [Deltaproteobacteria bacterium]